MASLDGLHVVDLSRNVAGPPAATLLGKIGAEVVEVERPPLGDEARFADNPARGGHRAELHALIEERVAGSPAEEVSG